MKQLILIILVIVCLTGCTGDQINPSAEQSVSTVTPANSEEQKTQEAASQTIEENNENDGTAGEPGNHEITTPVLIKGLLIGGLYRGEWMRSAEFYNSGAVDFNGYHYDVYVDDMKKGTATGGLPIDFLSGATLTEDEYIPGFDIIKLFDENKQKVEYDIAIRADWDLYPRKYNFKSNDQDFYNELVTSTLAAEGLDAPDISLKQVIRVDLDGDGTEEVLITADNTVNGQFEQVKKGDYAICIFRKLVGDTVEDQVVEKDIRLEDEQETTLYRNLFSVESVADLDGDGIMEVVLRSWYYEGEGWAVYKLIDGRLQQVASNGVGV